MLTATLTLTSNGTNSGAGVSGATNLYTDNNANFQCTWSSANGDRWAEYSTNATSLIPAGSVLKFWRIRYRVYSPSWLSSGTPLPKIWFAQYSDGIGIGDYNLTATETQYTWPNPDFHPSGVSLDGVLLSGLTSLRFGGTSPATSGTANLYFDELIVEIDYETPVGGNTLFFGENF